MTMTSDSIQIEGFESSIKSKKVWFVGDESLLLRRLNLFHTEMLGRGKFVCVQADSHMQIPKAYFKFGWDAFFRLKDSQDLRLALTYITNATKPLTVVWIGEEMPPVVFSKVADATVFALGSRTYIPKEPWDALFFPPDLLPHSVEEMLATRLGSGKVKQANIRSVLAELRTAKASLVWSKIDDVDKHGYLYWIDTNEGQAPEEPWNPTETAQFLRELSDRIASAK
jgi:hypothetical protein